MATDVRKFEFTDSMSEMGRIGKNWRQSHLGLMALTGSSIPYYHFYVRLEVISHHSVNYFLH